MKKIYCDVVVWKCFSNIDVFTKGGTKHILELDFDFSNDLYSKNRRSMFKKIKIHDEMACGFYELDLLSVKIISKNHAIYTGCLIIDEDDLKPKQNIFFLGIKP